MKTKILALAFIALAPFAASAASPSYSFADFSYQLGSIDPGGTDFGGLRLDTSFAINDNWFVTFDYSDFSLDPAGDLSDYALSAGWHGETIYAKFGYETIESGAFDDSGYALEFGARWMASEQIELDINLGYSDLGNFDTYTKIGLGGVWMFGDNMGVSFNYDMWGGDFSDIDSYGFGFRYNFN